jgi:hypothetical protein
MSTIIVVDARLRHLGVGRFFPHIQDRYGILNHKFIDPKKERRVCGLQAQLLAKMATAETYRLLYDME